MQMNIHGKNIANKRIIFMFECKCFPEKPEQKGYLYIALAGGDP